MNDKNNFGLENEAESDGLDRDILAGKAGENQSDKASSVSENNFNFSGDPVGNILPEPFSSVPDTQEDNFSSSGIFFDDPRAVTEQGQDAMSNHGKDDSDSLAQTQEFDNERSLTGDHNLQNGLEGASQQSPIFSTSPYEDAGSDTDYRTQRGLAQYPLGVSSDEGYDPLTGQRTNQEYSPGASFGNPGTNTTNDQSQPENSDYSNNFSQHPYPPQKKSKKKFSTGMLVVGMVAAGLVGGLVATGVNAFDHTSSSSTAQVGGGTTIVNNKDNVNAVTAAAEKAAPSVVTISAVDGSNAGTGSGAIIDNEGHIITNTHVVTLAGQTSKAKLEVRLRDGSVRKAELVGTDPLSDLAIIKVDPANLPSINFGSSSKLNIGENVAAIGAPQGLDDTVTDGIISNLNRTIQIASSAAPEGETSSDDSAQDWNFAPPDGSSPSQSQNQSSSGSIALNVIQTDASINQGNSGGPLINTKGEIIGINVAIASSSESGGSVGLGFAIPGDYAKRISQELIKNGKATHGQLGVEAKAYSKDSGSTFTTGAQITSLSGQDSPAEKAGLKKNDVITAVGGRTVTSSAELSASVRQLSGGSEVTIEYARNGRSESTEVKLGSYSDSSK